MKNFIFILLTLLGTSSCVDSFEDRLAEKIDEKLELGDSIVSINEITDFKWDTVHIVNGNSHNIVEQIVGPNEITDIGYDRVIIFCLDGSMVHYEILPYAESEVYDNYVEFEKLSKRGSPEMTLYRGYRLYNYFFCTYTDCSFKARRHISGTTSYSMYLIH
ncbi:hypothetical protein OAT16_07835 [Prolixibacteraceae bacterium]|nr:hypothetical protein [Prolixibacteraceae bacterium]